ncbi:Rqc2 family fibronectin-binding protein [Desulfuribacillus alkaliarsenatis]|uniref:Rqc2 homolog RqcH n=1 Tax=Desulfuribacillus alkaliarsenatis TaxID=766136 RepID=A0A1E5G5U1_9FIRM|nr:NFACT RNA binding domain-containing protein [Desulfuribacillus alkaliarsenatis]OEF98523.1 hypothetical protein BHF68_02340 [Desulfuribacillus alkaliarsenatis]
MAFDGIVIRSVVHELSEKLIGGRVDKIYQPLAKELIIRIRTRGENHQLFLSADPTHPRIHLTQQKFINPDIPPMFCMLLRKHLENSHIKKISQWNLERIITLEFETTNEIGDPVTYWLIIEIMGRHSNIIFVNPEKKTIIDSIYHVNRQVNSYRELLPGKDYFTPPSQDKLNMLATPVESIDQILDSWKQQESLNNTVEWDKFFLLNFQGVSPLIAKELWARTNKSPTNIISVYKQFVTELKEHNYKPCIVSQDKKFKHFSALDVSNSQPNSDIQFYSSINACIENFYTYRSHQIFVQREAQDLLQKVVSLNKRATTKLKKLKKSLQEADEAEHYKLLGELLTANLYNTKRGLTNIKVVNYYDPEQALIEIPLDPAKSPNENAQSYFKKYNKQKNSVPKINEQIELTNKEIAYFESILQQLDNAELPDVTEIRQELIEEGYVINKEQAAKKKKKAHKNTLEPLKFRSSTGLDIWVGRNNKQNDLLTTHIASKNETWLHTKDIPGSHVVIRHQDYDEQTLIEAASIAAFYSKARGSSQVPVDYTLVRNVKKPSGSKPGYVIYEQQKTLYVTPDEQFIKSLHTNV